MANLGNGLWALQRSLTSMLSRVAGQRTERHRTPPSPRESWDRRWARSGYEPPFEIGMVDPAVGRAVEDGWFQPGMAALDIGCGAGQNAAWLAEHGLSAVGIDFAASAIARARSTYSHVPDLSFEVADATVPHTDRATFDVLIDRGCLHGIKPDSRAQYAANVATWARPGAHFLLIMRSPGISSRYRRERGVTWLPSDLVVSEACELLAEHFDFLSGQATDLAGPGFQGPIPGVAMRFVRSLRAFAH